jgi:RNA polymerase sigma-70 factor (ECF subfamily)
LSSEKPSHPSSVPGDIFATTHWTVVLAAGRRTEPQAQAALEQLCRTYWFPLYAYVRRRGYPKEDAEDLTQEFFHRFLTGHGLENLDGERGRFRAFLLAALKHFLANEWDKSRCQKRGGGATVLSLDWHDADASFQVAAVNELSPDQAFDREWAVALLGKVLERLSEECAIAGKAAQFEQLKAALTTGKGETSYAIVAINLQMEETAVRVAVHRLRKRYRQLLRAEIANTLADQGELEEELRALFGAFSR